MLTRHSFTSILLAIAVAACGKVESASDGGATADAPVGGADASVPDAPGAVITAFVFRAADNARLNNDVTASITGTNIVATLPPIDVSNLVPTITHTGSSVTPMSGVGADFASPVEYTLNDGTTYAVTVQQQTSGFWWGAGTNVYWSSTDGSETATVVNGLQFAHGVAVDTVNGALYYSDYDGSTITKANIDGTNPTVIVNGGSPSGIALDLTNNKMYWANFGSDTINRADLDGGNAQILNTGTVNSPINVALDPGNNDLYFITYNSTRMGVMAMSGGADTNLLNPGGQGISVAIDAANNKMYFSNRSDSIGRCDLDGRNLNSAFISGESSVHGLAIDTAAGKIYWVTASQIRSANLADGSNKQDITPSNDSYVPGFVYVP